jgi:hypothetical protein
MVVAARLPKPGGHDRTYNTLAAIEKTASFHVQFHPPRRTRGGFCIAAFLATKVLNCLPNFPDSFRQHEAFFTQRKHFSFLRDFSEQKKFQIAPFFT